MTILVAQSRPGKGNDESFTPELVLERVRRVDVIGFDPCTTLENPTRARRVAVRSLPGGRRLEIGREVWATENGLAADLSWAREIDHYGGLGFVNPPYSRGNLLAWMQRCYVEAKNGAEIIALPLCDPSALWWHQFCCPPAGAQAVCFWRGRLAFPPQSDSAFFPSALVYYGPRKYRFAAAFEDAGAIWM